MRKRFDPQLQLGQTPIEAVAIPTRSRDELPPLLAGLQWIFRNIELREAIFDLLEEVVVGAADANNGRPGMDLWHILVLGTVRLGLGCDFDRLEHIALNDRMVRAIMGCPVFGAPDKSEDFHHRTISDNLCRFDEALLTKINELVVIHGLGVLKKKPNEKLQVKTDSYVYETNVHYPTDTNLLFDAARKCADLLADLCDDQNIPGWRKYNDWKSRLKGNLRRLEKAASGGGANKAARVEALAKSYLQLAGELEEKVHESLLALRLRILSPVQLTKLCQIDYFHTHLIRHMDLVARRLLQGETIPHGEKVFSLFEEHTELIKKGKVMPPVEFGHRLLICTSQHGLILDYKTMVGGSEAAEVVPQFDRLLTRLGPENIIQSASFDQGFSSEENRELLELYIPEVIMAKRGARTAESRAREGGKKWKQLREAHSAVESDINCLEHHGLDRCRDKGWHGYQRSVGMGVLAYNLHKIGAKLLKDKADKKAAELKRCRPRPTPQAPQAETQAA